MIGVSTRRHRGDTHTKELEEIPMPWLGGVALVDADWAIEGAWTRGYPQTLMSPEEPPYFEQTSDDLITVNRVTDADGEDLILTVDIVARATAAVLAYVNAHRDDLLQECAQDVADAAAAAAEAAYDAEIDRRIDERRERGYR
jgi:hypothetical protein